MLTTAGIAAVVLNVQSEASHAGSALENGRNALYELTHQILQTRGLSDPATGLKMNAVLNDLQVKHLGMVAPVKYPQLGDSAVMNQPFVLSRTSSEVPHELGYSDGQVTDLRKRVVA